MATKSLKSTPVQSKAKISKSIVVPAEPSFWQRRALRLGEKKLAKKKANKLAARQAKSLEVKRQRAEIQAEKQAVKATALAQVEQAVQKSQKPRSHPFAIIFLLAIIIVLSGAAAWLYREQEITVKNDQINQLEQLASSFSEQQSVSEAAKEIEAAKYQTISAQGITMRLPVSWQLQPTQYPVDETIYGDANVSLRIIRSESRNSIQRYIPRVNYLWQIAIGDNSSVVVKNQSMECDRFDTLDNNLAITVREHNGFHVYCETNGGQTVIAALGTPDNYGVGSSGVYFLVVVHDIQQVNFDDIKSYIQSTQPSL